MGNSRATTLVLLSSSSGSTASSDKPLGSLLLPHTSEYRPNTMIMAPIRLPQIYQHKKTNKQTVSINSLFFGLIVMGTCHIKVYIQYNIPNWQL